MSHVRDFRPLKNDIEKRKTLSRVVFLIGYKEAIWKKMSNSKRKSARVFRINKIVKVYSHVYFLDGKTHGENKRAYRL